MINVIIVIFFYIYFESTCIIKLIIDIIYWYLYFLVLFILQILCQNEKRMTEF